MAERYVTSFIYLFAFAAFTDELASKSAYIEYGIDNERICNPATAGIQKIDDLQTNEDSAIMVKPGHSFDTWLVSYSKHCKFKIRTAKDTGLFAVIQKIHLRHNGSECLDYIRFTAENIDEKTVTFSDKYCGQLSNPLSYYKKHLAVDGINSSDNLRRMFEISSTAGRITTEIYISKQPLLPGQLLDFLIAYTPFIDCDPPLSTGLKIFRWKKHPYFRSSCIHDRYKCDHIKNCVNGLCSDESNCTFTHNEIISDGMGTKVTISAVTTIMMSFIVFILCVWQCKKQKKLCWSPDCAGPSTNVSVNNSANGIPMEQSNQQSAPNPPVVSSAPMLEVAVSPTVEDKDLPPSYDALFPTELNTSNNSNAANT